MNNSNSDVLFRYASSSKQKDPWLRNKGMLRRFVHQYRQLPFVLRMGGVFMLGFVVGAVIEVFACKTHLYEIVLSKKERRRHELDEFVVDFRENLAEWQKEDQLRAK